MGIAGYLGVQEIMISKTNVSPMSLYKKLQAFRLFLASRNIVAKQECEARTHHVNTWQCEGRMVKSMHSAMRQKVGYHSDMSSIMNYEMSN